MRREADVITAELELRDQDAAFSKVWDIYHGSFDDDADIFAEGLKLAIRNNAAAISPENLSAAIVTLKKLGYMEGIDEIIQAYVDIRQEGRDFWIGDPWSPRFNVYEPDVAAAFAEKANEFVDERTLESVAASLVRERGWDNEDLKFIDAHSVDDFYAAMKATKGEQLRLVVYGLTYFRNVSNPDESMESISAKAVEALERIGRESKINRLRVEKFGVVVPEIV